MRTELSISCKKIKRFSSVFIMAGSILLLSSCGIKESSATGGQKEEKAVSNSAIEEKVVSHSAIEGDMEKDSNLAHNVLSGSAIEEEISSHDKEDSNEAKQDEQEDEQKETNGDEGQSRPIWYWENKEKTKLEFTIQNKNTHAIMGITLPKGWNYNFVGSAHSTGSEGLKCCCAMPTEDVRRKCTCDKSFVDEETMRICQNYFLGKGEQSTNKKFKEYGIIFWKEENPEMKIKYVYDKDRYLYCATRVTIENEMLNNGGIPLKATSLKEQTEDEIWYSLILDRTKFINGEDGDYLVKYEGERKWWDKNQKEIKDIIDGITLRRACR